MLPRRLSTLQLLLAWVIVTLPSVLISFNWTLPIYMDKAEEVNELIQGWSFAFSSSLLFWMVTEWIAERKRLREAASMQRVFLDAVQAKFNEFVRGCRGQEKVEADYFWELTNLELYQTIENWADVQERDGDEWACAMIRWLLDDVIVREADIAYYRSTFSRQFNSGLNEALRQFQSGVRHWQTINERRLATAMADLGQFRRAMIEMDNIYRKEHGKAVLQHPG